MAKEDGASHYLLSLESCRPHQLQLHDKEFSFNVNFWLHFYVQNIILVVLYNNIIRNINIKVIIVIIVCEISVIYFFSAFI